MKKIFSILLVTLICVTSAAAKSSYVMDVVLGTQEVTIVKDDVTIKGVDHNPDKAIALFRVTKEQGQVHIDLCSINHTDVSNFPNCKVSRDGTVRIGALSVKIESAAAAFKEAMKYLDDTDTPIYVFLYQ